MSLPMAVDPSGLPIGVHFAGPVGSEAALLGLAYELESAQAFHLLNPLANEPQAVKKTR
jgi:amidase